MKIKSKLIMSVLLLALPMLGFAYQGIFLDFVNNTNQVLTLNLVSQQGIKSALPQLITVPPSVDRQPKEIYVEGEMGMGWGVDGIIDYQIIYTGHQGLGYFLYDGSEEPSYKKNPCKYTSTQANITNMDYVGSTQCINTSRKFHWAHSYFYIGNNTSVNQNK